MKQNKITSQGMRVMAGTLTIVLLGTTIVSPIPAHAAETAGGKEEVVYVMTDAEGNVESVNVVNIFGKGDVTDYGDYSSVKMLTSTEPITQAGDKITFSTQKEKVYYQGTLENAQIPWNIDITYKLDGKEVSPEELAGQSGTLEIRILITENTAADDNFYDNYALQAAFTLDSTKCENIVASGATLANVGSDKQISYTVLPGKGLDAVITADVVDFEMDAAAINGVKLDLNIEVDDSELMDKVAEIKDATTDLNDGANDLKDGAGELNDGAKDLKDGATDLNDGAKDLKDGAGELNDGAKKLDDGAKNLYDGMNSLDDGISSLNNGISTVQDGLNILNVKSNDLTGGSTQVQEALKTIQSSLNNVVVSTDQLKMLTDSSAAIKQGIGDLYNGAVTLQAAVSYDSYNATLQANGLDIDALVAKNTETITGMQAQVEQMQATLEQIKSIPGYESDAAYAAQAAQLEQQIELFNGMIQLLETNNAAWNGSMSGTAGYFQAMSQGVGDLVSGLNELQTNYAAFDTAIGELVNQMSGLAVNMTKLKGGIDQLVTQYGALDSGIQEYTAGVASIVSGYGQLTDGASKLASGSKELLDGSSDLKRGTVDLYDGTKSLYDGTVNLYDGTQDLYVGTADLYDGTQELYDGTVDMQDGTKEFYDKTYDMDTEVRNKIDDMLAEISGSDEPVVSFVSDKNKNVNSVQFVIKTAAIEKEDVEDVVALEETQTGFFQKLIALFRK